MRYRFLFVVLLGVVGGWWLLSLWNGSQADAPVSPASGKSGSGEPQHSPGYSFTPIAQPPMPSDPPGSNADDQTRLDRLILSIEEDGKPKREQGIVELRAFLQSTDPRVRLDAATMLYEMKDRSGYAALLDLLRSPDRVPGRGGIDLRNSAARTFARYREQWAGEALLNLYEKTKSIEVGPQALVLRLEGMAPYMHEFLKERISAVSLEALAVLETQANIPLFVRIADNDQVDPEARAAAIFGLAKSGDEANLERLIAVATNAKEALPGNHDELWAAQASAAKYLTNFRGERVVKVFEDMLTWKNKEYSPPVALAYLRYRYPKNQPSREIVKAGLQPGGSSLGWDYTFLLQLACLSGDPELIALGKQTDYFTSFRELDVRAARSNAWLGEILPDWEGDW